MKFLDPSIELIAAGSTSNFLPTYMEWDREVLDYCWDDIDYLACHYYSHNRDRESRSFLAEGLEVDRLLEDYRHVIGFVRGRKRSTKKIHVSFDEWNVWHQDTQNNGNWQRAPHLLEEVYNFESAMVCAQFLASFIRNADLVKVACLAQLVNVIAPILTKRDALVKQAIYHPFVMIAQHARGRSLSPRIDGPTYKAGKRGDVPALDVAVTHDTDRGEACAVLINRDPSRAIDATLDFADQRVTRVIGLDTLHHNDLKATNTWEHPERVKPKAGKATVAQGGLRIRLPGPSLAVVRLKLAAR
jgi:alpha-N-arabinofuranosidase